VGKKHRWRETFKLIRLHILVEGQTEEGFIKNILAPALGVYSVFADAHSITTGRRHGRLFRGGLTDYEHLARDLTLWMKQDQNEDSWFTTMVDFYGLPRNFPGRESIPQPASLFDRIAHLEAEFSKDIATRLVDLPVKQRFIPYIQLHEFEALLFSEPAAFVDMFPNKPKAIAQLKAIRACFASPEDIDDGQMTAPSKRILNILSDYQKPVAGLLIAKAIGLGKIRSECPRFHDWFSRLEALV